MQRYAGVVWENAEIDRENAEIDTEKAEIDGANDRWGCSGGWSTIAGGIGMWSAIAEGALGCGQRSLGLLLLNTGMDRHSKLQISKPY